MRVCGGAIGRSQLLAVMLAVVLLAGCGGGGGGETAHIDPAVLKEVEAEEAAAKAEAKAAKRCPEVPGHDLHVALDEWKTPEIAGILMATQRKDFADLGLKVSPLVAVGPTSVIPYVVKGVDDMGVSHEPDVVLAQAEGAPIVILGSLVPRPTAAVIWLKRSHINGIADLKGRTIAIPGLPFQEKFLEKMLARVGLTRRDVKVKSVGYKMVPDLLSGRVDAIFGRSNLQGAELEARGLEPVVTSVQGSGVPAYDEAVLIAHADCVAKRPKLFRKFMVAVGRGTAAAIEDPGGVMRALMSEFETNPETGRKAMKAEIRATIPLLSKSGSVSPAQVRSLVSWMQKEGMLQRQVPVSKLLTPAHPTSPQSR